MALNEDSSIAELRTELERKRRRALDLQMQTTDHEEWSSLNEIRWELEDLDNDLYRSQFLRNNDRIEKLINKINEAGESARNLVDTLAQARQSVQAAREKLKATSAMVDELTAYYQEVETMLDTLNP